MSSRKGTPYFVEFRSRYALTYGHTYVVFGRVGNGGQVASREVAGLHPASNSATPYVLGHFIPVPAETGWSDGDLEEQYRSASWRVMLDEASYSRTVAYIRKKQASSQHVASFGLQLQRLHGRHSPLHGIQGPVKLSPAPAVRDRVAGTEYGVTGLRRHHLTNG